MTHEDLSHALRALDTPYLIDSDGRASLFGVEFPAITADGRRVTVTHLDPALVAGLEDVDAFLHVFAQRQHRAIGNAAVIGAGITQAGVLFVVHDSTGEGESLADRLRRDGSIPSAELRAIAEQIMALLQHEHAASLVHGLVYPETIRIGPAGRLSLGWSGLLSALRAGGLSASEIARRLRCTSYLAPEFLNGAHESISSDIYAAGATLYEAMTGRPPFGGRTTATIMAAVLSDDLAARPDSGTDVLTTSILRAIEREPVDRWHNAGQFHAALIAIDQPVAGTWVHPNYLARGKVLVLLALGAGTLVLWRVFR